MKLKMESLGQRVVLEPALLERYSPGEIIKLCYTSNAVRERCRTDEIIQDIFLRRLRDGLLYFIEVSALITREFIFSKIFSL